MRLWVGVMVWCLASTVQADTLTRREVQIMHDAGIRMALMRADGTSEKPYVIPVEIRPEVLLQTELLDFSGQPLSQVPGWLVKFKNLRKLDLSNTGLRVDGNLLAALGNMPELSVLNLSRNPLFPENDCLFFCDPVVTLNGVWQKLTQLTELDLINTGATAENLGSFAPLENLTHLYLGGNRIGDGIAKLGLKNPSNLKKLNLDNNGISQDPLPDLPTQSLVELGLAGNDLRELAFVDMPNLEQWDVSRNPNLKLAAGFGDMFALGALQVLGYDSAYQLPQALVKRLNDKMEKEKAAAAKAEEDRQKGLAREARKRIKMVTIPAGSFTMGCDPKRDEVEGGCQDNEKPAHTVSVPAFKLAETEVTRAQFRAFVDATGYKTTAEQQGSCAQWNSKSNTVEWVNGSSWLNPGYPQQDNHPVVCVSWDDATAYIAWLNKGLASHAAFRLPTEAEWEYAARGKIGEGGRDKDGAYPWGQEADDGCAYANALDQAAKGLGNYQRAECDDGYVYTAPVGRLQPNGFGLYDMHGNVWEWVEDCWQGDYKDPPVDGSAREGCGAGASRVLRVLRGGSWGDGPRRLRSATRHANSPAGRFNDVGFRAARTN